MSVRRVTVTIGSDNEIERPLVRKEQVVLENVTVFIDSSDEPKDWTLEKVIRRAVRIDGDNGLTNLNKRLRGSIAGQPTASGAGQSRRSPSA